MLSHAYIVLDWLRQAKHSAKKPRHSRIREPLLKKKYFFMIYCSSSIETAIRIKRAFRANVEVYTRVCVREETWRKIIEFSTLSTLLGCYGDGEWFLFLFIICFFSALLRCLYTGSISIHMPSLSLPLFDVAFSSFYRRQNFRRIECVLAKKEHIVRILCLMVI